MQTHREKLPKGFLKNTIPKTLKLEKWCERVRMLARVTRPCYNISLFRKQAHQHVTSADIKDVASALFRDVIADVINCFVISEHQQHNVKSLFHNPIIKASTLATLVYSMLIIVCLVPLFNSELPVSSRQKFIERFPTSVKQTGDVTVDIWWIWWIAWVTKQRRREGQNLAVSQLASDSMTSRRRSATTTQRNYFEHKKITKMLWRHVSQINDTPLDAFCTTKFQTEGDLQLTSCSHEHTSTGADSAAAFLDTKKLWNHACSNCCCCFMVRKQQRYSSFSMPENYVCKQ